MGSTRFYCIAILCLSVHAAVFAGSEQASAMMRAARFQQLTGNIEAAAGKYFEAAALETGNPRDEALTAGAFCLAAMGEWEKASAAVAPVLREGGGKTLLRAYYLEACARAWLLNDTTALRDIAENSAFREIHSAIYYTLWKLAEGKPSAISKSPAEWRSILANEFPNSPEGRMAKSDAANAPAGADPVSLRQGPFWLLLPGQEGWQREAMPHVVEAEPVNVPVPSTSIPPTAETIVVVPPPPVTTPVQQTVTTTPTPVQQAVPAPVPTPATPTRNLQTGFFGKESNALAQVEKLKAAGFTTAAIHRVVRENVYWVVIVPAGQNMNTTIAALKKAGFESFPLPAE